MRRPRLTDGGYHRPHEVERAREVPQRSGLFCAHPRSSGLLIVAQQRFQLSRADSVFAGEVLGPLFPQPMGLQLRRSLQGREDQSSDRHVERNEQKEQVELSGVSARLQGRAAAAGATFLHGLSCREQGGLLGSCRWREHRF